MFSVRLRELPRTSSFRLGAMFAGLFGLSSLVLFAFLYWQTSGYLSAAIDDWLERETAARALEPASELAQNLDARVAADPDGMRPIALFGPDGTWLGGSHARLPANRPQTDRPFAFTMPRGDEEAGFRGILHRLPSGELLLVARDMRDLHQFRDRLLGAMAWGGLVVLFLGFAGAAVIGAGALARIAGVTRAIERIVGGDLGERLPSGGRHADLARLIQLVNRMLDEIERLMREVQGVSEDIAHDLRTPLTRLLAGLERVRRRGNSTAEYEAAVEQAILETKGILATFAALLRIAEVESGARREGFTTLDLNTVAADVAELYEPVAEAKGISLRLASEGRAEIPGDPNLMFEVISNLVDNAIKYSPVDSRVAVRVLAAGDRVGVEVSDAGPGIPEAERQSVLRRFHRIDRCRNTPGSGLGLSLVAAVARLHDLDLAIADAGPGCRVTLWRAATKIAEPMPPSVARTGLSTPLTTG
jgi:signal transduction histidine kinase